MLASICYEVMQLGENPCIELVRFWSLRESIQTSIFDTATIEDIFISEIIKILCESPKNSCMCSDKNFFSCIFCDNLIERV